MNVYKALNQVNISNFVKEYNLGIKGIYHKKQGYNTSNQPYNFSPREQEELKRAFLKLSEDLAKIDFLNE